jgi:hypothetical protein
VCVRRLSAELAGGRQGRWSSGKVAAKEALSSDGMIPKNAVSAHMVGVKDSLLTDGYVVPIGVQCGEAETSVLCNLASVKDPSAGDMGLKHGSVRCEGYELSYCNFCVKNHSLTCKVARKRVGWGAGGHPKDHGSRKVDSAENSLCDAERARNCRPCNEFEDTSWEGQGRTCVKNGDSLCNWRRRRRGVLWQWLVLVLLGAAPLVSGQLRPNTDITTSRAEGGKLCVYICVCLGCAINF